MIIRWIDYEDQEKYLLKGWRLIHPKNVGHHARYKVMATKIPWWERLIRRMDE